jgi:hypothetical protein
VYIGLDSHNIIYIYSVPYDLSTSKNL